MFYAFQDGPPVFEPRVGARQDHEGAERGIEELVGEKFVDYERRAAQIIETK